jgi:hypothetical protein
MNKLKNKNTKSSFVQINKHKKLRVPKNEPTYYVDDRVKGIVYFKTGGDIVSFSIPMFGDFLFYGSPLNELIRKNGFKECGKTKNSIVHKDIQKQLDNSQNVLRIDMPSIY